MGLRELILDLRGLILGLRGLSFGPERTDFEPERADLGPERGLMIFAIFNLRVISPRPPCPVLRDIIEWLIIIIDNNLYYICTT